MGTTYQTMAVRTSEYEEVKSRIVRWLSAKGFEQAAGPALFERDREDDDERGLCLLARDSWVIVLYSHVFEEGERLRFELTRPEWPLLTVWTFDSDIWGYELRHDDEPVAVFNSNPRYFGRVAEAESPPGATDDPEVLCRLLGLGPAAGEIARLQRKRALFKELTCRKFCRVIGAEPAARVYDDLRALPPLSTTAAGWRVDHFRFVERGASAAESAQPLHAMVRKPRQQPEAAPWSEAELNAFLWPYRVLGFFVGMLVRPLARVFGMWFRLSILFGRMPAFARLDEGIRQEEQESPFPTLHASIPPATRRDGALLINDIHRCQVTLPSGCNDRGGPHYPGWVFQLDVAGQSASCHAIRPQAMHRLLREMPNTEVRDEDLFFAGTLQARAWTAVVTYGERVLEHYVLLVQTPQAFYQFTLGSAAGLPDDAKRLMRQIGESFRTT